MKFRNRIDWPKASWSRSSHAVWGLGVPRVANNKELAMDWKQSGWNHHRVNYISHCIIFGSTFILHLIIIFLKVLVSTSQ